MSGRPTELNNDIIAIEDPGHAHETKFKGRRSTAFGAIVLILLVAGAAVGITLSGMALHDKVNNGGDEVLSDEEDTSRGQIRDGRRRKDDVPDAVKNPLVYTDRKCLQPNYQSKRNRIVASFSDGREQAIPIKGVVWYGMEEKNGVPLGLWDSQKTGTTLYEIGSFLSDNGFNSVRLPLCVEHASRNIEPNGDLINTNTNKALRPSRYIRLLSTIVQGLGVHSMSVLLDFHTLTPKDAGSLWFNNNVRDKEYKAAIDGLAKELCNGLHWNVLGIEIKNAPNDGTWGDGTQTDWKVAAQTYGDYILQKCPKWLVFVDGIQSKRPITLDGASTTYRDFEGAGLQEAGSDPVELGTPNKLVWSPHYYSPSKIPQPFFYDGGDQAGGIINNYVERSTEDLNSAVDQTMEHMFGYLAASESSAMVLAEFGGIVGESDLHPEKTSTRVVERIIQNFNDTAKGYAGGYLVALNPSTSWPYNPADDANPTSFGLLGETWRTVNQDLLQTAYGMNGMSGMDKVPCVTE